VVWRSWMRDGHRPLIRSCVDNRRSGDGRWAHAAGSRTIEDGFAAGKELTGLDEHQARCWSSWCRWTILAIIASGYKQRLEMPKVYPTGMGLS
jgi:hypothetical protein